MSDVETPGSCLARIRAYLQTATGSNAAIARYILENPERVRNMPIARLADSCGASASTVSRFCTGLGYGGYKEFQLDLAATLAQRAPLALEAFNEDATPEEICSHVFESNRRGLVETERLVDKRALVQVSRVIRGSARTLILGMGGSGLVALEAAQRFLSLGVTAVALVDPYDIILATGTVGRKDAVMAISHTGRSTVVLDAVRTARELGAATVALTNYPQSPLARISDYTLATAVAEHRVNAAVSSSRIAQICVIDALYFIVGSRAPERARDLSTAAEERVRALMRTSEPGRRKPRRDPP